jgi:predicted dithiol-disulfide oxidoreductase (DUF899 family)
MGALYFDLRPIFRRRNRAMKKHKTGTREQWLRERIKLLKEEKKLTHKSDELARKRQALPWVRVDKPYTFETEAGKASLKDLFRGRTQLVVYHFMFGPDYTAGCPSCSSIADSFNGVHPHLAHHDVMFWAVSRAPLKKLQEYKRRMGWSFPWASSFGTDFNYDYSVGFTEAQQRKGDIRYNFTGGNVRSRQNDIDPNASVPKAAVKIAATTGTDWATYSREAPGMSAFALQNGSVYHTYSAYARGLDVLWNMYQWLDRAPLGRNETDLWFKRHDEYKD